MIDDRKPLPQGVWLTVRNVPSTEDESYVIKKFAEGGIDLDEDQISVSSNGSRYASCIVSLHKGAIRDLVERSMHASDLEFVLPKKATR